MLIPNYQLCSANCASKIPKLIINVSHFKMSLKAEMEVAMKLLEKDIHDKQDTIISLRRQLDDIKLINLEMYKKLQVRPRHFITPTNLLTINQLPMRGKTIKFYFSTVK